MREANLEMDEELTALVATVVDAVSCAGGCEDDGALADRVRTCLADADLQTVASLDPERLAAARERRLDADARAAAGQFSTPGWVAEFLSQWAVRDADDRVLDPCCGAGAITTRVADRQRALGLDHATSMERVTVVDRDPLAMALCGIALAARDESRALPNLQPGDFFELSPTAVGAFDATVANPPYVRQESFATDRERYRAHLQTFGPPGETPYDDGDRALDGRCDLYCYFLTQATRFLRAGGRLAWVVPSKWLVADYGTGLRRFLLDQYRLHAVVGFRTGVFDGPQVDAVLVLAERRADPPADENDATRFVRLRRPLSVATALDVVGRDPPAAPAAGDVELRAGAAGRTVTVRRSALASPAGDGVGQYLAAPGFYLALRDHPATRPLERVASVSRGQKTGANAIFVLTPGDRARFDVEERFCRPAIKSARELSGFRHGPGDVTRWFLDVHEYVRRVRDRHEGDDLEASVLEALAEDGYDGLLSYLSWADRQPARTNASLNANDPWFDQGPLATAPIVCPQAMDTRRVFARCVDCVPSNRFLLVTPTACDPLLFLGLSNGSLTQIAVESHGRVTGGGAVNLSASDLRSLPVPDPDAISTERCDAIRDAARRLLAGDADARQNVDRELVAALDLDVRPSALARTSEHLKRARRGDGREAERHRDALAALERQAGLSDGHSGCD
jgi:adenine-specific DNA methylase